ncbi:hypothetical protein FGG08_001672 [Glutinoglossum americanum]|uniref:Uncharacterized protein n=1 Tax=Glutinoglossum americanum TaxID=1670608 RepID=A0A9P8L530_9PEZI|nr:hypothetical protein FGG08_001672 [Glutinoglossum americanum]
MAEQPVLIDDNKSFQVDEIKEILDKRSENGKLFYLVVLKETQDECSESWLLASKIKGDITSLTGIGRSGSISTTSSLSINKDDDNNAKKRKRSTKGNKKNHGAICVRRKSRASGRSNSAAPSTSSTTVNENPMLEGALEEVGAHRIREAFLERLDAILGPRVTLVNDIDNSSPSLNFRFIDACVLGKGVTKASEDSMYGCNCKPDNGRRMGCEYTTCECLDQMIQKRFPYIATGDRAGTLRDSHLRTRDAIFECNRFCNCGDNCKNKLVQWGRKVPLEIFKTSNRGWGLRCPMDLRKGEFIDIYKGEIITNSEANRRERLKRQTKAKDTYLYTMEKFAEDNGIPQNKLYIVDGEFFGGPTRFMNHSCNPNCRQFSVSYHHGDMYIYDLAFFAIDYIPAGTELTFNYTDNDHIEKKKGKGKGRERKKSKNAPECLCGSENCRGYIWM